MRHDADKFRNSLTKYTESIISWSNKRILDCEHIITGFKRKVQNNAAKLWFQGGLRLIQEVSLEVASQLKSTESLKNK